MNYRKKKMDVRIKFTHMWPLVNPWNFFRHMPFMFDYFNFIDTKEPDFVMCTGGLKKNLPGKYLVRYTAEPGVFTHQAMEKCDWAFSFTPDDYVNHPRHMRFPSYRRLGAGRNLVKSKIYDAQRILAQKKKFCAFVYADGGQPVRNSLFHKLSKYKQVDSPGPWLNNVDESVLGKYKGMNYNYYALFERYKWKLRFIADYKFVFACESRSLIGYTSEKIYHAMLVNSIPIYWGNPRVAEDFNVKSFVNHGNFLKNPEKMPALPRDEKIENQMVEQIIELDQNDKLYCDMLDEPWYPNNKPTKFVDEQRYIDRFREIFSCQT